MRTPLDTAVGVLWAPFGVVLVVLRLALALICAVLLALATYVSSNPNIRR